MIKRLFLSIIAVIAIAGCNKTISKEEQQAINEEIASRKIRRITDAQIYDAALKLGDSISAISQKALGSKLMYQVTNYGPEAALDYCNVNAYPIIDSLSTAHNAVIRRTSLRLRNPEDAPDELERQLLDAYAYNIENSLELKPGLQKISDQEFLYTRPIIANNGICLKCHGEPGVDVPEDLIAVIKEKYPKDNAMGHEINDLRGMWSIKLDRKDIVKNIRF
jgi:hypothetical protein